MARTQKPKSKPVVEQAETEVESEVETEVEAEVEPEVEIKVEANTSLVSVEIGEDEDTLTPLPIKVEPKPKPKTRRNLGGFYITKNRVSFGGKMHGPGEILEFTDEEARHYLKFGAVKSVEDE